MKDRFSERCRAAIFEFERLQWADDLRFIVVGQLTELTQTPQTA
ncbi:hypothetical protein [Cereibacter johrii]|nr:hypothetical protein [Cereibacter johrii]